MSTTKRKARKRAGVPFTRTTKTPTPVERRSHLTAVVPGAASTKHDGQPRRRSASKAAAFLKMWGLG